MRSFHFGNYHVSICVTTKRKGFIFSRLEFVRLGDGVSEITFYPWYFLTK